MKKENYKILEEKNIIDDHLLDIIGNEFKFEHEKGLAEWLKNSTDAYIRTNTPDNKKYIILRFNDQNKDNITFECIDFMGMTSLDIDKALKRWGDPEAAKRGLKSIKRTHGGHGNGGKFYMRQMFKKSHFITYKNGLLNIFGFNEKRRYGFADNHKDEKVNYKKALEIAGLEEKYIPDIYLSKIKSGQTGFTIVKGIGPNNIRKEINAHKICEKLKKHPQSMRIMERINVQAIYNEEFIYETLKPEKIKPLKDFENPRVIEIPSKHIYQDDGDNIEVYLSNEKYESGKLILRTSEMAFTSNSKYSDLNRIDIIGELGAVASYQLRELGLYYPQTDFIYGECVCPILEDPNDDCIMNDRTKLAENLKSKVLLKYINQEIERLCKDISNKDKKEREDINKKMSSNYNIFLNQWKNKFMSKVLSEILVGPGNGPGIGKGDGGSQHENNNGNKNKKSKNNDDDKDGGGSTPQKGNRYPRVLLSDHDDDPLNKGNKLSLQPGHGLIYQRAIDVNEGIYWINTSSPLAESIITKYGANSTRWRNYLFQRYVDIFIKEALITLEKKEPDRFNAFTIEGEILGKLVTKIHDAAAKDLISFLFDDNYKLND